MTCCNHNCNQGRACPARIAATAQAVSQVRAHRAYVRHDGSDPLRGSAWRRNCRRSARIVLAGVAVAVLIIASISAIC